MAKKQKRVKKAPRPRNPQDTTMRNVRAASRRAALLKDQVGSLSITMQDLQHRLEALEAFTGINRPPQTPPGILTPPAPAVGSER